MIGVTGSEWQVNYALPGECDSQVDNWGEEINNFYTRNWGGNMANKRALVVCLFFIFILYSIGCGKKHKTKEENYPDGKLKAVYTYNDAGLLDGVVKTYYESGELKSEKPYQNNSETGIEKEYYKSGNLSREVNWKDGKILLTKEYFESGKVKAEFNYKDGGLNGMSKTYYENGKIKSENNFRNGKGEGLHKYYYESGKLEGEFNFKDGKQHGLVKAYYENGKLRVAVNLKDGKPLSSTCYDDRGNEVQCTNEFFQDKSEATD